MTRHLHRFVAGLSLVLAVGSAFAATRDEASAQVNAAVAHVKKVGLDQAVKDFNAGGDWKANGMNVMVVDAKGFVLASSLNERIRGKETLETKDPSGKFFVKESITTAQKGDGWVDYQFVNPEAKKIEERSMYVKKAPGLDGFIGVAITK